MTPANHLLYRLARILEVIAGAAEVEYKVGLIRLTTPETMDQRLRRFGWIE